MVSVRKNRVDYITVLFDCVSDLQNALQMIPGMINESNIEGRTLLHLTALMNKPDVVLLVFYDHQIPNLLLPYHHDFSIRDIYGLQAIHYCAFSNVYDYQCVSYRHLKCILFSARNWEFQNPNGKQDDESRFNLDETRGIL